MTIATTKPEEPKNGPLFQAIILVKEYLRDFNTKNPELAQALVDGNIDTSDNVRDFFYDTWATGFLKSTSSAITKINEIPNSGSDEEIKRIKIHLSTVVEFSPKLFTRLKSTNTGITLKAALDSNARFKVKFALDALAGMVKSFENSSKKE